MRRRLSPTAAHRPSRVTAVASAGRRRGIRGVARQRLGSGRLERRRRRVLNPTRAPSGPLLLRFPPGRAERSAINGQSYPGMPRCGGGSPHLGGGSLLVTERPPGLLLPSLSWAGRAWPAAVPHCSDGRTPGASHGVGERLPCRCVASLWRGKLGVRSDRVAGHQRLTLPVAATSARPCSARRQLGRWRCWRQHQRCTCAAQAPAGQRRRRPAANLLPAPVASCERRQPERRPALAVCWPCTIRTLGRSTLHTERNNMRRAREPGWQAREHERQADDVEWRPCRRRRLALCAESRGHQPI